MMIHEITEKVGRYKSRKRIGRGRSSGTGKTSGRGHKGAKSRSGSRRRAYFEGGQTPFYRRMPKRGFSNFSFKTSYSLVNLKSLDARFETGAEIDPAALAGVGLIRDVKQPVKILGEGELTGSFTVRAHKFSASARDKIESAGGTIIVIERKKWTRLRTKSTAPEETETTDEASVDVGPVEGDAAGDPVTETVAGDPTPDAPAGEEIPEDAEVPQNGEDLPSEEAEAGETGADPAAADTDAQTDDAADEDVEDAESTEPAAGDTDEDAGDADGEEAKG